MAATVTSATSGNGCHALSGGTRRLTGSIQRASASERVLGAGFPKQEAGVDLIQLQPNSDMRLPVFRLLFVVVWFIYAIKCRNDPRCVGKNNHICSTMCR